MPESFLQLLEQASGIRCGSTETIRAYISRVRSHTGVDLNPVAPILEKGLYSSTAVSPDEHAAFEEALKLLYGAAPAEQLLEPSIDEKEPGPAASHIQTPSSVEEEPQPGHAQGQEGDGLPAALSEGPAPASTSAGIGNWEQRLPDRLGRADRALSWLLTAGSVVAKTKMRRWLWLLAPALAAAFPSVFLYAHNIENVYPHSLAYVYIAAAAGSGLVVSLVLLALFHRIQPAAFVGSVLVLLFFLWSAIFNGVPHWLAWLLVASVTLAALAIAWRYPRIGQTILSAMVVSLLVLVGFNAIPIARFHATIAPANIDNVYSQSLAFVYIAAAVGSGLIGGLVFLALFRRIRPAAFGGGVLVLLFLLWGAIFNGVPRGLAWLLVASVTLAAVAIAWRYPRIRQAILSATVLSLLVLVGFNANPIARFRATIIAPVDMVEAMEARSGYVSEMHPQENLPDIYYIILDSYPSQAALKEVLYFDNSEFTRLLEQTGFYVAGDSHSAYNQTKYTLPSTLNMDFFSNLIMGEGQSSFQVQDPRYWEGASVYAVLDYNLVAYLLKQQGYKYVYLGSVYPLAVSEFADLNITRWSQVPAIRRPESYPKLLFDSTALSFLPSQLWLSYSTPSSGSPELAPAGGGASYWRQRRNAVLYQFQMLGEIPTWPERTFVFSHIYIPHNPYLFAADGSLPDNPEPVDDPRLEEYFLAQLQYTNKLVSDLVQRILSKSSAPPVIIIQGDHGYRTLFVEEPPPSEGSLGNQFAILNAFYFPDGDYSMLYPSISSVNTFRVVLNKYFGADLPLLEDRAFWPLQEAPWVFEEVTGRLGRE